MTEAVSAFVPLKGHSSRVPGKNLREFHGSPLFHVIVNTLNMSERVVDVYIDTDDDEIASSAKSLPGVVVLDREEHLKGDDVSVNLLIGSFFDRVPDAHHVIQTHATNPLLTAPTVDDAVDAYLADDAHDSLFAVTRYQARFFDGSLNPINHNPDELIPTQELEPLYLENSNFYLFSRASFGTHGRRIGERPGYFEMDPMEALDIDEEKDFAFALAVAELGA